MIPVKVNKGSFEMNMNEISRIVLAVSVLLSVISLLVSYVKEH